MTLRDEAARMKRQHGPQCSVRELLDSEIGEELAEALSDPTVRSAWIYRALAARGVEVGAQALQRHRRGDCGCR